MIPLPLKIRQRVEVAPAQDRVPGDCWLWQGSLKTGGYGQVYHCGRRYLVHRFTYELLVGPIPPGLQIDHLCRVRACCNPAHLEPVTNLENALRSERATRTHCIRGHALTPDNLFVKKPGERGRRQCLTCLRAARRRSHLKQRGIPLRERVAS